eukprot:GEMP01069136.1.p1 GENE.GEMP01069136.1~~GEMP01069136.1.p1  ORF type:complete len:130 (+),score=30.97 GEMP01069136.1:100-489(+)
MAGPSYASDSSTRTTTTPGSSPTITGRHKRSAGQTHTVRRAARSTNKSKSREHVVLDLTRENIARFYMAPKNELKFIGRGDKDAKSNKAHKQASKERPELLNFAMGRLFKDLDTMYTPGSLDHLLPRRR